MTETKGNVRHERSAPSTGEKLVKVGTGWSHGAIRTGGVAPMGARAILFIVGVVYLVAHAIAPHDVTLDAHANAVPAFASVRCFRRVRRWSSRVGARS
jgi:hypothetical protein